MSFCVLGSGSAGNCSALLLHRPDGNKPHVILLDLGLSMRETERRLNLMDLSMQNVDDILLTHFDRDHFNPVWVNRLSKMRHVKVHFHVDHWGEANRIGAPEFSHEAFQSEFELAPGCIVQPVHLAHDEEGTTGFRIETTAGRFGFATDLGRAPQYLLDEFQKLTLLALESNYCPQMQEASDRPYFLKNRIMGGKGHLSNEESFDAVTAIAKSSPDLRKVVLLHLSRECNSPGRILDLYARNPALSRKVVISDQKKPIKWINVDAPGHEGAAIVNVRPNVVQHSLFGESAGRFA